MSNTVYNEDEKIMRYRFVFWIGIILLIAAVVSELAFQTFWGDSLEAVPAATIGAYYMYIMTDAQNFYMVLHRAGNIGLWSVSTATITSYVIHYLTDKPPKNEFRRNLLEFKLYGMKKRKEIYGLDCILNVKKKLDICTLTARTLLNTMHGSKNVQEIIEEKLKEGLALRIVTMNPNSEFLAMRAETLTDDSTKEKLQEDINKLISWAKGLNGAEIRISDFVPSFFYLRADGYLFSGGYLPGITSDETMCYVYRDGAFGFNYHEDRFQKLFNDAKII